MKVFLDDHHGIGDVAMFISVLEAVKKKYSNAEIHMLVKSPVEQSLIETVGGVSKFYYYDPLNHNFLGVLKLILELRKNHYDIGICHIGTNAKFGAALMKAIGCKQSVGTDSGNRFFNYTIPIDTSVQPQRARKNALLLAGLGIKNIEEKSLLASITFPGVIGSNIKSSFGDSPVIGICIGTGSTKISGQMVDGKKWPENSWLKLINTFIANDLKIILFGGNKELQERSLLFDQLNKECVLDYVGKLTLPETLEAVKHCDLLIAGDTGIGFCAALMDVPTLSLLGPSDPLLAAPYGRNAEYIFLGVECSPCYGSERMRNCSYRKCMEQITVNMVYEKSMRMLK